MKRLQSHKGFLMYEEMQKYLTIDEEVVSHIPYDSGYTANVPLILTLSYCNYSRYKVQLLLVNSRGIVEYRHICSKKK
jgi:hypothetical protein